MRYLFAVFILASLLQSCGGSSLPVKQPCPQRSSGEIVSVVIALLSDQGFEVEFIDTSTGIVRASMPSDIIGTRHWYSSIRNDTLLFTARVDDVYWSSKTSRNGRSAWYWNIRDGLQRLCGITPANPE